MLFLMEIILYDLYKVALLLSFLFNYSSQYCQVSCKSHEYVIPCFCQVIAVSKSSDIVLMVLDASKVSNCVLSTSAPMMVLR